MSYWQLCVSIRFHDHCIQKKSITFYAQLNILMRCFNRKLPKPMIWL